MSSKTDNLGLTKPSQAEYYDVNVSNGNMDIIDANVGEIDTRVGETETAISTLEKGKLDKNQYASISQAGTIKLYSSNGQNRSGLVVYDDGSTLVNVNANYGLSRSGDGKVIIAAASEGEINAGTNEYKPLVPATLRYAIWHNTVPCAYAVCTDGASVQQKSAWVEESQDGAGKFELKDGMRAIVKFTQGHSAVKSSISIDGTGAKYINYNGIDYFDSWSYAPVLQGGTLELMYDADKDEYTAIGLNTADESIRNGSDIAGLKRNTAVCNTAKTTAAKTATLPGFTLTDGAWAHVRFKNGLSAGQAITLNINGTGAKDVKVNEIDFWGDSGTGGTGVDLTLTLVYDSSADAYMVSGGDYMFALDLDEQEIKELRADVNAIVDDNSITSTTTYSSQKIQSMIDALAADINTGHIYSWAVVKEMVVSGAAKIVFPVGTQFTTKHATLGTVIWDVADHQDVEDADGNTKPGMQLLMHYVTDNTLVWDAQEALMYFEDGLTAGTYHFTIPSSYDSGNNDLKTEDDTSTTPIQFTTTSDIPAGGQLRLAWNSGAKLSTATVTTYASGATTTALESGIYIARGTAGTSLGDVKDVYINGDINTIQRNRFGSNNYKESAIRQYLNATGTANTYWQLQTKFDRIASYVTTTPGFAAGFDDDFLAAVCPIKIKTCTNNYAEVNDDVKSSYTTVDKFYLPSYTEIAGAKQNNISEGERFAMTEGYAQADFIKYNKSGSAQFWWFRSPYTESTSNARYCNSSGNTGNGYSAHGSLRIAAACTIA